MQWASIEAKISSKVERKETAPIGPQSAHAREVGKFNKRKDHKSESNAQTFHSCKVLHHIAFTHCIRYMFSYLKQECRVKKGLAPRQKLQKDLRGEKRQLKHIEVFKNLKSQSTGN